MHYEMDEIQLKDVQNVKQEPEIIIKDDLKKYKEESFDAERKWTLFDTRIECQICNKFFKSKNILRTHQKLHHGGKQSLPIL